MFDALSKDQMAGVFMFFGILLSQFGKPVFGFLFSRWIKAKDEAVLEDKQRDLGIKQLEVQIAKIGGQIELILPLVMGIPKLEKDINGLGNKLRGQIETK